MNTKQKPDGEQLVKFGPQDCPGRLEGVESRTEEFIEISEDAYKQNSVYKPWEKGSALERLVGEKEKASSALEW